MTAVAEPGATHGADLERRAAAIRQKQLLLTLEQWGAGYRTVAGDWLTYVGDIADATDEERAWLRQHVAEHGEPGEPDRTPEQWHHLHHAVGRRANAAASAAFLAGRYDQARDLIDEARAYGELLEGEWRRLHEFITTRAGSPDDGRRR